VIENNTENIGVKKKNKPLCIFMVLTKFTSR